MEACIDVNLAYLEKLNARLQEGRITTDDKERLWQTYLVRIRETVVVARVQSDDDWPYTFVAPMF